MTIENIINTHFPHKSGTLTDLIINDMDIDKAAAKYGTSRGYLSELMSKFRAKEKEVNSTKSKDFSFDDLMDININKESDEYPEVDDKLIKEIEAETHVSSEQLVNIEPPQTEEMESKNENNMTELRSIMFKTMKGLKNGTIKAPEAKEISKAAEMVINSVRVELDFVKLTGGDEIKFLGDGK